MNPNVREVPDGKQKAKTVPMAVKYILLAIVCVALVFIFRAVLKKIDEKSIEVPIKEKTEAEAGDYILFGSYEQDNKTRNGKEDIEWLVLAREEDRILVISRYALDCVQYNPSQTDVTWENCKLRGWLNSAFLEDAFTDDEQGQILESAVTADSNPRYNTSAGNDTVDRVFLLSMTEAEEYLPSEEARKCGVSDYTAGKNASVDTHHLVGGKGSCWWWLRTPGGSNLNAVIVGADGTFAENGFYVFYEFGSVRPAMWITLN